MPTIAEMMAVHRKPGEVRWIGLSPGRKEPVVPVQEVVAERKTGLVGDRHALGGRGKRQVTLIQEEHLAVASSLLGQAVGPADVRRNVVVRGINLYALRKARFWVGEVLLEGTGLCDPCSRMEANLGPGGFNAMRGHGGITAIVLESGTLRVGDAVKLQEHTEGFSPMQDLH